MLNIDNESIDKLSLDELKKLKNDLNDRVMKRVEERIEVLDEESKKMTLQEIKDKYEGRFFTLKDIWVPSYVYIRYVQSISDFGLIMTASTYTISHDLTMLHSSSFMTNVAGIPTPFRGGMKATSRNFVLINIHFLYICSGCNPIFNIKAEGHLRIG